jgi:hypothetical protein
LAAIRNHGNVGETNHPAADENVYSIEMRTVEGEQVRVPVDDVERIAGHADRLGAGPRGLGVGANCPQKIQAAVKVIDANARIERASECSFRGRAGHHGRQEKESFGTAAVNLIGDERLPLDFRKVIAGCISAGRRE